MDKMMGAAKRLIFSLLVATLGGCAVYSPYPYAEPGYYGVAPVSLDIGIYGYGRGGYGHGHGGHHGRR